MDSTTTPDRGHHLEDTPCHRAEYGHPRASRSKERSNSLKKRSGDITLASLGSKKEGILDSLTWATEAASDDGSREHSVINSPDFVTIKDTPKESHP